MQRLSPRFRSQQFFLCKICGETFYPNLQRFVWRNHAGAHSDRHQHGGRKPTETSVTEFCYKSVKLSLEEFKNIKIILFSNIRIVRIAKLPELSHIFNQHDSSLGRHVNAASRKSSEIQASVCHKTKNPFGAKICMNISFQLLLYIMEEKCQEDQQFCSLNFSDVMGKPATSE